VLKLEISTRDENWNEVHEEIGTGAYLTSVIGFTASVNYDPTIIQEEPPPPCTTLHILALQEGTLDLPFKFPEWVKVLPIKDRE
jgi:hypothetical protein